MVASQFENLKIENLKNVLFDVFTTPNNDIKQTGDDLGQAQYKIC